MNLAIKGSLRSLINWSDSGWCWWLTRVRPATWEVNVRKIARQKVWRQHLNQLTEQSGICVSKPSYVWSIGRKIVVLCQPSLIPWQKWDTIWKITKAEKGPGTWLRCRVLNKSRSLSSNLIRFIFSINFNFEWNSIFIVYNTCMYTQTHTLV
jgi:hypothetical protein